MVAIVISVPAKKISTVQVHTQNRSPRAPPEPGSQEEEPRQRLRDRLLSQHLIHQELGGPGPKNLEADRHSHRDRHDGQILPVRPEIPQEAELRRHAEAAARLTASTCAPARAARRLT